MIQLLATKFCKHIAYSFLLVFYTATALPVYGIRSRHITVRSNTFHSPDFKKLRNSGDRILPPVKNNFKEKNHAPNIITGKKLEPASANKIEEANIGGPTQPEMSRFKSASADNLVNIFTGDFSYNIPLLDVGGYPVNIFYDGGITPEEEASWVGLGWNINPGTVSRNMRGIPDDFNGTEKLTTMQSMKPNITWGGRLGVDFEFVGIKGAPTIGASLGVSVNNYLGPALEPAIKGGLSFKVSELSGSEKHANSPFSIGAGINANLSSRGGLTIAPNVSLTASKNLYDNRIMSGGIGLSTSYNSRTGISNLNISGQLSFSRNEDKIYYNYLQEAKRSNIKSQLISTSISFAKPSYTPSIRMPITNEAYSGHFQLGGALWGVYVDGEIEVYKQSSWVAAADVVQSKPMVGYLYYQKANTNADAVVDFTRFNDKEVTPHTPIVSVPQYSYDVFSINGEGTGGSIRMYRNDYGYVRDNYTKSQDKSLSIGADIGIPGHYGANVNSIKTPTTISEWGDNNKLRDAIPFTDAKELNENVYFRNPGETSVLNGDQFDKIGGTDLVRFKLAGSNMNPALESVLERFSSDNHKLDDVDMISTAGSSSRKKRTQVVNYFTAEEAANIGLNKEIKSYNVATPLTAANNLASESFLRVNGDVRLAHHISQINVTEANGSRYIYDLPVYNTLQKDLTFTVSTTAPDADLVTINPAETGAGSAWLLKNSSKDGYLQVNQTPPYAHSFLLGGLLSPDYVDVSGNGISEDDLGTAVKFNYTRIKNPDGSWATYKWRTPNGSQANTANFNAGNRTEIKDDKGIISYGERESWYLHSVESKTMIALFTVENRQDGKGALNEFGGRDNGNALKRLKKIDLYSKADLKKNGLTGVNPAKPVKTVFFEYSYKLCSNSSDNSGNAEYQTINGNQVDVNANKGKLTLERIYFTFNGQNRANKNQYKFVYENSNGTGNPGYGINTSDRWGSYKPKSLNPAQLRNADYPYSFQPSNTVEKETMNQYAGAWDLKKILLPSGGQIEVDYESDDYAFVQDRRAAGMMSIAGFGKNNSSFNNLLYSFKLLGFNEHNYVFINVPEACANKQEVYLKYLQGQEQFAFRLAVKMLPDATENEYISSYATIDYDDPNDNYGIYGPPGDKKIWVKLKTVDGLSPLSISALEFLKEQLPGQAFPGYDVSGGTTLDQFGGMIAGLLGGLRDAFRDPIQAMRIDQKAKYTDPSKCFVRLNDPDGYKYGGGHRVKKVVLKDNWNKMTTQYTSQYGTEYDYTTTEVFNGQPRTISSGVASYEPSIGGDENPFQTMVQIIDRLPLGPSSYGAVEMPVLDAFFPAPIVGYSKVTVRTLKKGEIPVAMKSRSGVGRQVTEFYTAKDFPVYYRRTSLDPTSDIQAHKNNIGAFFWKWAFDSRAISQGFLVATNDMHGKMKSQSSFAENDPSTMISYTENFYRNTGINGMNEKFDFAHASLGGEIKSGNMGIDVELMTDTREFSVKSISKEIQGQLDLFPVILPAWLPFIWGVKTKSDNIYRAVTCTKVISYHSIVDRVVVIDKGSKVSMENLVYDAETGEVIVNRTNNEFDKPVYSVNYPAYWAYSGMGLAYKNIDAVYSSVNFLDGKIVSNNVPASVIESGDELYIIDEGDPAGCNPVMAPSAEKQLVWALDKNKNTSSLTNVTPDYIFIDKDGKPYSRSGVKFRIVRSGKRNMLGASVAGVTLMADPVRSVNGVKKLVVDISSKSLNASAIEYREKWQTDNDVIKRLELVNNPTTCISTEEPDCLGYLEKRINPYSKGLIGSFKPHRSFTFYGERAELNPIIPTNLPQNGFLSNFSLYWNFNTSNNLVPVANPKWVWNNEATRFNAKGLELETRDALNIYTSAQYGYNKTLPVAITNNARYNEMFAEGFEDADYNETLNGAPVNDCPNKHINFGNIYNAETLGFIAHTGKSVLGVGTQATYQLKLPITTNPAAGNFDLNFGTDIIPGGLYDEGGNIDNVTADPDPFQPSQSITNKQLVEQGTTYVVNGNAGMAYSFTKSDAEYCSPYEPPGTFFEIIQGWSGVSGSQYLEIKQCGNYQIDFNLITSDNTAGASYIRIEQKFKLTIRDLQGNLVTTHQAVQPSFFGSTPLTVTTYLDKGVFLFSWESTTDLRFEQTSGSCNTNGIYSNEWRTVWASFAIHWPTGQSTPSGYQPPKTYKTLASLNNCYVTRPIAATDEMLNPTFSIPGGKKMLFSAWVRENCGNAQSGQPCNAQTFTNSKAEISIQGGATQVVEINPAGPIIEGWQRIEGVFTAPAGATSVTINLVNNSGSMNYFDDIRIHPFNANMTSYVYDPVSLRLTAQLDANNYASFFEYDEEGGLIRTKTETKEGIKTINETRSAKQKTITEIQ